MKEKKILGYPLIRSSRKTCSIKVKADGEVVICAPLRMPIAYIEQFVTEKSQWIERTQIKVRSAYEQKQNIPKLSIDEILYLANDAKRIIPPKVEYYASEMGIKYNRITIRNQRTRWGSCSNKRNLNFNCLLMLAPDDVVDYVIVHELCHIKEMNHSEKFWAEVENVLPDYKMSYNWLKKHGGELMAKIP